MNVFILGAEGAGKTVFVAMLSRYLAMHRRDLVLEPANFETAKYVVAAQATLERNEWPTSTRIGQSVALRWHFGRTGAPLHTMVLYDAAGQDLRSLLLTEDLEIVPRRRGLISPQDTTPSTNHLEALRGQVHDADALVYLLDLESLIGEADAEVLNENCWLLKAFLTHAGWQAKKRIVVLTKQDKYQALLEQCGHDVRQCIQTHLPEFYSTAQWLAPRPHVYYVAVTSVATETVLGGDGVPHRRPTSPTQPGDMSKVVQHLVTRAKTGPSRPWWAGALAILFGFLFASVVMVIVCAALPPVESAQPDRAGVVGLLWFLLFFVSAGSVQAFLDNESSV